MNRLATRVTLIFFLAIAMLLIVLAMLFAFVLVQSQRASTGALQNETARRAAVSIEAHLDSLRAPLADATRLRPDLLRATASDQQAFLDQLLALNPTDLELALLDGLGQVRATSAVAGHHVQTVERDADTTAAFQAAQAGLPYLGHVHLTASAQEPYVVMSEPLPSGQGALVAWVDLRHIWEIVSEVKVSDSGYAYVLDDSGNLIAYRDPALVRAGANPPGTNAGLRAHFQSSEDYGEYAGLNGLPDIGAHASIETTHWLVVVETPLAEAYALLYRALGAMAVLLVIGIGVSAVVARHLAARLLDPVELLREGAALIGQGHLDHRIVIETGDEIEQLAAEFNRMTESLRRARAELEDWAHEMERRVQERSEEVVAQKEQLAVLEERQRVARELHDSISQALFTLSITLESAQAYSKRDPSRVPGLLERARAVTNEALGDVRALISELRPVSVEQRGLEDALRSQLAVIADRAGIPIDLQMDGVERLAPGTEDALYRIAQEAVNNAVKHAHASQIVVRLAGRDDRILLSVSDNGRGFDPRAEYAGHYGLATMRERARALGGDVIIESALDAGTTVRAEILVERK